MGKTLAEKVWDAHIVHQASGEPDLLFIDLHLVHEVTSPQAFDGLRASGRKVRRPDLTLLTEDHNVPTKDIDKPIADLVSRAQVDALRNNSKEFDLKRVKRQRKEHPVFCSGWWFHRKFPHDGCCGVECQSSRELQGR